MQTYFPAFLLSTREVTFRVDLEVSTKIRLRSQATFNTTLLYLHWVKWYQSGKYLFNQAMLQDVLNHHRHHFLSYFLATLVKHNLIIIVYYLLSVDFHNHCPSSAPTCFDTTVNHMTVHRDFFWADLERVGFVYYFRPDEVMSNGKSKVLRVLRWQKS